MEIDRRADPDSMSFRRGELRVSHRSIGQERFGFASRARSAGSSLDALVDLIDWAPVARLLDPLYPASKSEPASPPLAMSRAQPLSVWCDLSDV